ncbi:hypothetical protein SAMN02745124_04451 [Desulfofustis glycolicus DSM 9705]|uniref:Uncharacterized protein n=1 Tax=Desulfofustis glycolicus DSM 9705 TaxID=1121409 RepID=A0A1M5YUT3_9BACT|nr:hypothetical protein SAMN02745124_04451 [Desulfofustis glycolicus DSM 9705]
MCKENDEMKKVYKYLYFYIRICCLIYPFILAFAIVVHFLGWITPTEKAITTHFIVFMACIPAFIMLPGLLFENYKASYHGMNLSQITYSLFMGVTLGLGPIYLFFKYYDRDLMNYYNDL